MAKTMRETETHFHVGSFRISKKGLNPKTLDALKLRFADGGAVPDAGATPAAAAPGQFALPAQPGTAAAVAASAPGPAPEAALTPQTPAADAVMAGQPPGATAPVSYISSGGPPVIDLSGPPTNPYHIPTASVVAAGLGMGAFGSPMGPLQGGVTPAAPAAAPLIAPGVTPADVGNAPAVQPQGPAQQGPGLPPDPTLFNVTGAIGQYKAGVQQQQDALAAQGPIIQKYMNAMASINQDQANLNVKAGQDLDNLRTNFMKQNGQVMQDIATAKIDPNRLFANQSTGEKIMGGIGMILAGIGSGLTGQPNLAVQLITRAIDRDVEAQHANLENKKSIVRMNMDLLNNDSQAILMARATGLAAASAMLEQQKNRMGAELAPMNIERAQGLLQSEYAKTMDQFAANGLQQNLARYNIGFLQAQRNALMMLADPHGMITRQGYAAAQFYIKPEQRAGMGLKPVVVQRGVDKDGRPIMMPTSQIILAGDASGKNTAEAAYKQLGLSEAAVARFKALERKYAGKGTLAPEAVSEAINEGEAAKGILNLAFIAGGLNVEKPYKNVTEDVQSFIKNPVKITPAWFHTMRGVIRQMEQANGTYRQMIDGTVTPGPILEPAPLGAQQ